MSFRMNERRKISAPKIRSSSTKEFADVAKSGGEYLKGNRPKEDISPYKIVSEARKQMIIVQTYGRLRFFAYKMG